MKTHFITLPLMVLWGLFYFLLLLNLSEHAPCSLCSAHSLFITVYSAMGYNTLPHKPELTYFIYFFKAEPQMAQASLELTRKLPWPSGISISTSRVLILYACPQCPVYTMLGIKPEALCTVCKHTTNWATYTNPCTLDWHRTYCSSLL